MNPFLERTRAVTRRHLLGQGGLGVGAMALSSLLPSRRTRAATAHTPARDPLAARPPTFKPRARSVIYLHMAGAPSQVDLFDYKPALAKFDGQACPKEYLEGKRFAFIKGVPTMLAPQFKFHRVGQSGQWVSELLPNLSSVIDQATVIRSMHTNQFNHAPAQL
ncbi:MAG: DUF1501 domain-containing protein, partial [Phycisphaerae bacterium]|nr:DUF1501 domain-containing protein [Phycisphaerae bacterium]